MINSKNISMHMQNAIIKANLGNRQYQYQESFFFIVI